MNDAYIPTDTEKFTDFQGKRPCAAKTFLRIFSFPSNGVSTDV